MATFYPQLIESWDTSNNPILTTSWYTNTSLVATGGVKSSVVTVPTKFMEFQNLSPDTDISNTGWVPRTGNSIVAMIRDTGDNLELSQDCIYGMYSTSGVAEVGLSSITDPDVSWGHVVEYTGTGNYQVYLMEGTTVLASWIELDIEETFHQRILDQTIVNSITNYSNVYLKLVF